MGSGVLVTDAIRLEAVADVNASALSGPARRRWLARYQAAPSERIVQLGRRTLWFGERSQQIHELNETAALVWRKLASGEAPAEVGLALVGRGMDQDEAEGQVRTLLDRWLGMGELVPEDILATAAAPQATRRLTIGDLAFRVDFHGGLPPEFDSVFRQFADAGASPSITYELISWAGLTFLRREGAFVGTASSDGVLPLLKAAFTQDVIGLVRTGFVAHAACLHRDGAAWLLTGSAGAGKTTLCAALTQHGFGYGSDDVTVFGADGRVQGIPFALALKAGSWPLCAALFPELGERSIHERPDGQAVRYLPAPDPAFGAARLGALVALAREEGVEPRLEAIDPASTLTGLLAESFSPQGRLTAEQFEATARAVESARCFKLVYSDLGGAVAVLTALES